MWGSVTWRITRLVLSRNNQIKRAAIQERSKRDISFFVLQLHLVSKSGLPHYIIIKYESEWHPPVFESPPSDRQRGTKGGKWNPSATPRSRLGWQDAQIFSRSVRCRNGSKLDPICGFAVAIGLYQARLTLRSAVGCISTMSQSTSIPISSQPSSSCLASGISSSTLLAGIPGSLAPISLLSLSSC